MADSDLVKNYLHRIRSQFYPDDEKGFFQQRTLLVRAITHPAFYLDERGVRLPERRLCAILDTVIRDIQHFGATAKIENFCRYFLHAVPQQMKHQEDGYYDEGKTLRFIMDTAMENLTKKQREKLSDAQDSTTARLADLNRLVRETAAKKKKSAKAPAAQLDLL